jgi:hypothetical protein
VEDVTSPSMAHEFSPYYGLSLVLWSNIVLLSTHLESESSASACYSNRM